MLGLDLPKPANNLNAVLQQIDPETVTGFQDHCDDISIAEEEE